MTERSADPVLEIVTGKVEKLPSATLPNAKEVGETEMPALPDDRPSPVSDMRRGEEVALFVIETLPLAFPAEEGLNETVKDALEPA